MGSLRTELDALANDLICPVDEDPFAAEEESLVPPLVDNDITDDGIQSGPQHRSRLRARIAIAGSEIDDDIRYRGRILSRQDLDDWEGDSHSSEEQQEDSKENEDGLTEDRIEADDAIASDIDGDGNDVDDSDEASERSQSIEEGDLMDNDVAVDTRSVDTGDTTRSAKRDIAPFSSRHQDSDVIKGKAILEHYRDWDALLSLRIKLQGLIVIMNQLPRHSGYNSLVSASSSSGGDEDNLVDLSASCEKSVGKMVRSMAALHNHFASHHPELNGDGGTSQVPGSTAESDENIDSDDADGPMASQSSIPDCSAPAQAANNRASRKRKHKLRTPNDSRNILLKRHKTIQAQRENILRKWHDKTRISSGKLSKNFSAFHQDVVKQIDNIMADEDRLIRRTKLKRSVYNVIGEPEAIGEETKLAEIDEVSNRSKYLQVYDDEIFDDDDFYQQLLRILIEQKTLTGNSVLSESQWLQIQRMRKKFKKHVDTRASKGRKVRYDVIKKLVNFMAPTDISALPEETKSELFNSLFGGIDSTTEMN